MKRLLYISILLLLAFYKIEAQAQNNIVCLGIVIDGDTMPLFNLREIEIVAKVEFLTEEEIRKNPKLIRNVRKVYPYAKLAKAKLLQYNDTLSKVTSEKVRKEIMKKAEKELEAEFTDDIKKMTFSQGKVLIKLIDRETGNSSYDLVKELRGSFRAFFYQTLAKLFGFNLKTSFDPINNKEDNLINRIVLAIEHKQI